VGYYLTEDLVQDVADELTTFVDGLLEAGLVVTVIVADLSCRADWDQDKKMDTDAGESPLVLLERTYGEGSAEAQAEKEEMAETGLLMMDREGVSLDALFAALRQNIQEGDLYPSSAVAGIVAGHLAIAVAGLDQDGNARIMNEYREMILAGIAQELAGDDGESGSYYVGDGADDESSVEMTSA